MSNTIKTLDVVALLRAMPEAQLVQGQVGTVVEVLSESACEVEFCGDDGNVYATLAIKNQDLMVLHYSHIQAA
ncbi:DUF4926 domain-containing protein [Rhodoferax sp. 4810]|uniref:DUF4926 domain-containing protein n=1 Tax=Thiospirillum jenense TaxID=1653858 RepID=A0A839HA17_9GAMM|nr:DUF4926 domain-containing protein [Thiospirillum jenense]MBB1074175.1 DUF4926 domain-containing protein [Rhodoferax jenense]MBB1125250.1 DUF4926 domain-containing protein [Thiospirillum jenense]